MSDDLKARIRRALETMPPRSMTPPVVVRDGDHIIVKGRPDPLKEDFASSGKERQPADREAALAE